ncbi:MAG: hypothetical protein ACFE8M_03735 [Candidatus Hermodarchaeota archaeon]
MEELYPVLKDMLKKSIEIKIDKPNLTIYLIIKNQIKGNVAEPKEIIIMLKMFGGLREDIPMEININNEIQQIGLKFQDETDFNKIQNIMETIWEDTVNLLIEVTKGNFNIINDIPDVDD